MRKTKNVLVTYDNGDEVVKVPLSKCNGGNHYKAMSYAIKHVARKNTRNGLRRTVVAVDIMS